MKRLLRGLGVLAVPVAFLSCSGDPTSGFREPSEITASPSTVFINVGESKQVVVSLVDEQGNQIATDFEISAVGTGVTVQQDTAFLHTTAGLSIPNQVRYDVSATGIANSSFTVSAGGISRVIPVKVTPSTVDLLISNPTPAWGDTITLTAPAGALFTDTSVVTFAGGPPGDIVSLSDDRTVLTVVPGPNTTGAVTISHTTVTYDQSLDFTVTSVGTVTSPTLTVLEAGLSNQTPALGETVTLTLPAGIRVVPESVLAVGGLAVPGAVDPRSITVSTDSSVLTFIPAPNSDSVVQIHGVVPSVLPQFPQVLETTLKITTPVIDTARSTVSSATPGAGVPVILTSTDPAITFDRGTQVILGADTAVTLSATGPTLTFVPIPGSTGAVNVTGAFAAGFRLDLPTNAGTVTATNAAVAATPGTGSTATAPTIVTPAAGEHSGIVDGTPFGFATCGDIGIPCQVYKFVVAADGTFNFELRWSNSSDLGLYFLDAAAADLGVTDCDAHGNGAGNSPEVCSVALVAGTYYLAAVPFGAFYTPADPNPNWISIRVGQ
ncbi:MAG: pre-peptidase C-terminal domain-containing protein [Gemmatimonadales bacterium]|nr:pre-peptidase C-terminal domain-containing protein [Gemmatimonadales bacterium]